MILFLKTLIGNLLPNNCGKGFALYLAFLLAIWLRDLGAVAAFLTHIETLRPVSDLLSAAAFLALAWLFVSNTPKNKLKNTWVDATALLTFTVIGMIYMAMPDSSYDSARYHLYLQEYRFTDNVFLNFFPCGLQTFSLPMGDTAFGIFRAALGYRLGTSPNLLIVILLFLQMRRILSAYFEKNKLPLPPQLIATAAFLILSVEHMFFLLGTYMIDLLFLPLLLEALNLALFTEEERWAFLKITLLLGLAAAIKLIAIPFGAIILLFALIKRGRELTASQSFAAMLLLVLPAAPYLLYNYAATTNPIFPYFNSIFKSPYWSLQNFRDTRWMAHNNFEFVVWPALGFFHPERYGELAAYSGRFLILLSALPVWGATCLAGWFRRENPAATAERSSSASVSALFLLCILLLYSWTATTAHIRYAVFIDLLCGLTVILTAAQFWFYGKGILKSFSLLFILLLLAQTSLCYRNVVIEHVCWSSQPLISQQAKLRYFGIHSYGETIAPPAWRQPRLYLENMALWLRDRALSETDRKKLSVVGLWLSYPRAGRTALMNKDAPTINPFFINTPAAETRYREAVVKYKDRRIFSYAEEQDWSHTAVILYKLGFEPTNIFTIEPYFMRRGTKLIIFEVMPKAPETPSLLNLYNDGRMTILDDGPGC